MPVVEKVSGGRVRVRGIGEFAPGDRADVSTADAQYLCDERGDFALVNSEGGEDFEVNGWLDNDYQDRADAVREGGVDDYLNEIEEAETSQTVLEAIDERRDELED